MNKPLTNIALQARRLRKDFGSQAVLNCLDLEIAEGESVAIIGPNGAGKTTLLRCLAGLVSPSAGEIYWFGQPAAARPRSRILVGMVAHEGLISSAPYSRRKPAFRRADVRHCQAPTADSGSDQGSCFRAADLYSGKKAFPRDAAASVHCSGAGSRPAHTNS